MRLSSLVFYLVGETYIELKMVWPSKHLYLTCLTGKLDTSHPRFVVDSVIQRSLLCKDGLHFSSRGSVQVVVDLKKDISTVRASLHAAAQKRPVVSRPATPRPVVTPSEDTKTVSFSYRDALLTTFQILQPVSVPLFTIDNFPALSPICSIHFFWLISLQKFYFLTLYKI